MRKKLIGIAELSQLIGMSKCRIYTALINASDFPKPFKVGAHNRWDIEAVDAWLTKRAKEQEGDYVSKN